MIRNYHQFIQKMRHFQYSPHSVNAYDLRAKCGVFSKNELEYCNRLRQQVLNNSERESVLTPFQTILCKINEFVVTKFVNIEQHGQFVNYINNKQNRERITSTLLKQIRIESFKNFVEQTTKEQDNIVYLPYIDTAYKEMNPKILQYGRRDVYFIHPRTKLNDIITENCIDINTCKEYSQIIHKEPLTKLIARKEHIIQQILAFLNKSDNGYNFVFSKDELKTIKSLANKYDVIEQLLLKKGITTRCIEALIFSKMDGSLNPGDQLPNGDIVLKHTKIYDKQEKSDTDAIITFANTDRGYRFKIYKYDKSLYEKISQIRKQFNHFVKTNNIRQINELNFKLINSMRDYEIAEVFIEKLNSKQLIDKMQKECLIRNDVIGQLMQENEKYYYIKKLTNFNIQKYQNVSMPLISCLKDFGKNNQVHKCFLEALAFGKSKHSPVFLYLYAGCIPISHTREELENFLHSGFDFKKGVWLMYEM